MGWDAIISSAMISLYWAGLDGENYNIGLFDICSQPYPEMMEAVKGMRRRSL